jgi:UDPglucose 6-dehydrogenase
MLKLGVIGSGFVGSAVINGFNTPTVKQWVVDPKKSYVTFDELLTAEPGLVFVCVPTPPRTDGSVDASIIEYVLHNLSINDYTGIVVIKSTVTPDYLEDFVDKFKNLRIVYNPEFLTEANSLQDFINPPMQILGGNWDDCEAVEKAYVCHSQVKIVPTFKTDIVSASLLKYTINSWLATKVSFMNELYRLHQASGAGTTWDQFTDMLQRDKRIGDSHLRVPGLDGQFGFSGHCFPKDTKGLLSYAKQQDVELKVLEEAVKVNNNLRQTA